MCDKHGWPERRAAKRYMKRAKKRGAGVRRVYLCPLCQLWHMTSQTGPRRPR